MMDIRDSTTQVAAGGTALLVLAAFLLVQPTGLVRWVQRKNYQYEVTFALYMLTPTEKFVFNSVLFLTLSMLLIASIIYLPAHVAHMSRRVYYYFGADGLGDTGIWRTLGEMAAANVTEMSKSTAAAVAETATSTVAAVAEEAYVQAREGL